MGKGRYYRCPGPLRRGPLMDTVSLRARYRPMEIGDHASLIQAEGPRMYVVTARGVEIDTPDYPTALRLFRRWALPESEDS